MSEVSLDAESETTTTDLHMDYEEDHETEDSLRSDRGDENEEGDYESVDLDKDQSHPTGPWPEGGCEEPEPQLDADVQGVHGHPDVASSGDHVIMKGGAGDARGAHHHTNTSQTPEANGQSCSSQTQEGGPAEDLRMSEELHRHSAAHLPVSIHGDVEQRSEEACPPGVPMASSVSSGSVVESGPYRGSASLPTTPTTPGTPVAPSEAVGDRLARSASDRRPETGQQSRAVVLSDDLRNPAIEKLDLVRKWSINTYKCTRQMLSEKLGRGSKTVDLELESQIEVLRDNRRRYEHVVKLAQTLAGQLAQMMLTQRQLGDAFADLSLKSLELHEEFGYNAETQRLLSKNAETLLSAIHFFISSVSTLVDKTIEDTMVNIKQYEAARVEYDAYRTDLEELSLGPRDASTAPKMAASQRSFQDHRHKYEKLRNDVSIKLKFLEENKVKVLHHQLLLFHGAIAAYYAGNQQQLEQTLQMFHIKLRPAGGDAPSWLEDN